MERPVKTDLRHLPDLRDLPDLRHLRDVHCHYMAALGGSRDLGQHYYSIS